MRYSGQTADVHVSKKTLWDRYFGRIGVCIATGPNCCLCLCLNCSYYLAVTHSLYPSDMTDNDSFDIFALFLAAAILSSFSPYFPYAMLIF